MRGGFRWRRDKGFYSVMIKLSLYSLLLVTRAENLAVISAIASRLCVIVCKGKWSRPAPGTSEENWHGMPSPDT
jgi:hypothetical protein